MIFSIVSEPSLSNCDLLFEDSFESAGSEEPYKHTIIVDGILDFTLGTEEFSTTTANHVAYITWDNNYLYVGMSGPLINSDNSAVWLIIYIGGPGGTSNGFPYNTQSPLLPFEAKYHVRWRTDYAITNAQEWLGGWQDAGWEFTGNVAHIDSLVELRIPLVNIGCPSLLRLHISLINEEAFSEFTFAGVPSNSFIDGYDPDFSTFFEFNLDSSEAPKAYVPQ
jgi:hypothetical protein